MPIADIQRARRELKHAEIDRLIEVSDGLREAGKRCFRAGDMRGQALVLMARATVSDLLEHLEGQQP